MQALLSDLADIHVFYLCLHVWNKYLNGMIKSSTMLPTLFGPSSEHGKFPTSNLDGWVFLVHYLRTTIRPSMNVTISSPEGRDAGFDDQHRWMKSQWLSMITGVAGLLGVIPCNFGLIMARSWVM